MGPPSALSKSSYIRSIFGQINSIFVNIPEEVDRESLYELMP